MAIVKTMKDWERDFDEDFKAGDLVTEEIAMHFAEVVPPVSFRRDYIQCGEAYSTANGRHTYATFKRVGEHTWLYCGNCHVGETQEPEGR